MLLKDSIGQGSSLVYFDDILLMSNSKPPMLQLISELYRNAKKINSAPEKSLFKLPTTNYFGHEIGFNTIKPTHSKTAACHKIHKFFSATLKVEQMRFIGSMNFYSKFIDEHPSIMKSLYDWLHDTFKVHWNNAVEPLFQHIKTTLTKIVTLTIPITNHFYITVDSSLIGIGSVLFHMNDKGEMDIIS